LSFSGKGSEYIKLISNNPEDLIKSIFKLFRSDKVSSKMKVQIAKSPKKLTAEGALKSIDSENIDVLNKTEIFYIKDIETLKKDVKVEFNQFLEKLVDDEFVKTLIDYDEGMIFSDEFLERIKEYAEDSFEGVEHNLINENNHNPKIPLKSSMFFWYLKNTIYALSKEQV